MMTTENANVTLGEKLKSARKAAGMTQEQLAVTLSVSRQAVTKWEADKGLPDIENLKCIAHTLGVSLDYLLSDDAPLDMRVLREAIDLEGAVGPLKKAAKKDMIVRNKYAEAEIHMLLMEQEPTRTEKVTDNALGFLTSAPFGIPQFLNAMKHINTACYLVNHGEQQYLVLVTDEFIESRRLAAKITDKTFVIGGYRFTDRGVLKSK